jgi:Na+/H+ antiporter NhaC
MLAAERRAQKGRGADRDPIGPDAEQGAAVAKNLSETSTTQQIHETKDDDEPTASHWINAVAPIVVTLIVVVWLLLATGRQALSSAAENNATTAAGDWPPLREVLGAADSSLALMYGALAGLLVAAVLCRIQRLLNSNQVLSAAGRGAALLLPAVAILWTASAMSRMTGDRSVDGDVGQGYQYKDYRLYTGQYLSRLIANDAGDGAESDSVTTLRLMPTIVFLLAGVVSFCTGTSFGTMGLLVPMVITLTHALLSAGSEAVSPHDPLLLASVGAVLAGAVFGDHCSPISDTTILSSQACACDHIAHVVTQLPYAVCVAVVAVLLGTLPIGWGAPLWLLLPAQATALLASLLLFGRRVET